MMSVGARPGAAVGQRSQAREKPHRVVAFVEEAAAAASALDEQAVALADTVGQFRLEDEQGARTAVATRPALPAQGRRTAVAAPADTRAWQAL